jgi:hypothetical protein
LRGEREAGRTRLFSGFGLTLWRPWDWAVLHAGKDVENRDWQPWPRVLGRHIAIHSGLRWDEAGARDLREMGYAIPDPEDWPGGVIRGVVRVAGTVTGEHWSEWFAGPIGWMLGDPVVFSPVTCRGRKKLWKLPPETLAAVVAHLRGSAPSPGGPQPREEQSEGGLGGVPPQDIAT